MCFLENISLVKRKAKKSALRLLSFLQNITRLLKLTHFAWFSTKVLEAYERYANIILHPGAHLSYICTVLINLKCKSMNLNGALEKKHLERNHNILTFHMFIVLLFPNFFKGS